MQAGKIGSTSFRRLCENGDVEVMHISYSPVAVKTFTPVDSSDYSRGVDQTTHLIYSLALVESENGLLMPFVEIEETTRRQSNVAIGVMSIVILLAICIIVYISHILASSFTEPMIYLLGLIQYINKYVSVIYLMNVEAFHIFTLRRQVSQISSIFFAGTVLTKTLPLFDKSVDHTRSLHSQRR